MSVVSIPESTASPEQTGVKPDKWQPVFKIKSPAIFRLLLFAAILHSAYHFDGHADALPILLSAIFRAFVYNPNANPATFRFLKDQKAYGLPVQFGGHSPPCQKNKGIYRFLINYPSRSSINTPTQTPTKPPVLTSILVGRALPATWQKSLFFFNHQCPNIR